MSSLQGCISWPVHLPLIDYPHFIHSTTTNIKGHTYAYSGSYVPLPDSYAWLGCLLPNCCEFWLLLAHSASFSQGSLLVNRSHSAQGFRGHYDSGHWPYMTACNRGPTLLVAKSCLILCNPVDCRPPVFSVKGICQARILEWVAISISKGSSQLRDQICVSYISRWNLYHWTTRASDIPV